MKELYVAVHRIDAHTICHTQTPDRCLTNWFSNLIRRYADQYPLLAAIANKQVWLQVLGPP